jgi:hypothetical protein
VNQPFATGLEERAMAEAVIGRQRSAATASAFLTNLESACELVQSIKKKRDPGVSVLGLPCLSARASADERHTRRWQFRSLLEFSVLRQATEEAQPERMDIRVTNETIRPSTCTTTRAHRSCRCRSE